MQVIPVINCHFKDDECVLQKISLIKNLSESVHLDVADGIFTFNKTWNDPEKWKNFKEILNLEVHLMVENPYNLMIPWLEAGAKRIIFHWESIKNHHQKIEYSINEILDICLKYGSEAMISSCPETNLDEFKLALDKFNSFQVLAVNPGLSGQKFLWSMLDKIKLLRKLKPNAIIEVDGGITPEIASKIKEAGADIIVSGSYIFNSPNPQEAFNNLLDIVK